MSGVGETTEGPSFRCLGRDNEGRKVFSRGIEVRLDLTVQPLHEEDVVVASVRCPKLYVDSTRSALCNATGSEKSRGYCPYSVDLPHTIEKYQEVLRGIIKEAESSMNPINPLLR